MTEDTSPENLRKFLESDDPALVRMGISLAKGAGVEVTVKDLEHFLKSEDVETIKIGVMLADEAGIGDEMMEMLCCRLVPEGYGFNHHMGTEISEERREDIENNLWMLGQIGDKRAVYSLGDILESTDAQEEGWLDSAVWALGEIGDENAVGPLTELLLRTIRDPIYGHEKSLREDIRDVLSDHVPLLIKMLEDPDVFVVLALGEIGNALAVEPLIKVLNSDDEYVRQEAAEALGKIGDARAVDPLIKMMLSDETQAVSALGEIGEPAVEPLIKVLEGGNSDAAWALGEIGDTRAVEPLINALEDDERTVRHSAAYALGKIRDRRAVEPLIKALEDENSKVRRWAAYALGKIRDRRAVEALIKTLGDEDEGVRKYAKESLEELGHEIMNPFRRYYKGKQMDYDQYKKLKSQDEDTIAHGDG